MRRGAAPGVLAVVLFVACSSTPPAGALPTGALAPIAATATAMLAADVVDTHFDAFAARLDLKTSFGARGDVILDQLRQTRAAVATARASGAASGGPRSASVRATVPSLFSVPLFAQAFGAILDIATSSSVSEDIPGKPQESSAEDPVSHTRTTTTLRTTERVTSSGSRVTYSMAWTYRMSTVDTSTGAQLLDAIDERSLVGTIDVCPDAAGHVPATLTAHATAGATKVVNGAGQQVRSESKSENGFTGSVDDGATLRSVRRDFKEQGSWQTASGTGSYETAMSATHGVTASGGLVGGDLGGFTGTFTSSGDAGGLDPSRATAWTFAIDMWAIDDPFKAAQRLWRNGRCVVVVASDYGAETPREVADQQKPQHEETVDRASETQVGVNLKHRFGGGALVQPVTAQLVNGEKTVEPSRLDSVPGSVRYRAPDEDDKNASVQLRSTSKRGIGTLVIDFRTGADSLVLTITGELSGNSTSLGTVRILDRLTVGPLEFKSLNGNVYVASGKWTAQISSFTAVGLGTNTCEGSEGGDIEMMAHLEKRGTEKVWVIAPLESTAEGRGTETCTNSLGGQTLRGVTLPTTVTVDSTGDSGAVFVAMLKPFTLPAKGGSVAVSGSESGGDRGTWSATGTAVGRPAGR